MKFLRRTPPRAPRVARSEQDELAARMTARPATSPVRLSCSLGSGELSLDGFCVASFVPSPTKQTRSVAVDFIMNEFTSPLVPLPLVADDTNPLDKNKPPPAVTHHPLQRRMCSFIRVTDLKIDQAASCADTVSTGDSFGDNSSTVSSSLTLSTHSTASASTWTQPPEPHFTHVSNDPPPGLPADPTEKWIVLDNGHGLHAPIAPLAVQALYESATMTALSLEGGGIAWTPADTKTARIVQQPGWHSWTWAAAPTACATVVGSDHSLIPAPGTPEEQHVLSWWGQVKHAAAHGSDVPAVRVAGIIPICAQRLFELLLDSNRVHEYNQVSIGRRDVLVLQPPGEDDDGPFGGVTKIMSSQSRVLRKTLDFTTLLHGRQRADGSHVIVTRAVEGPGHGRLDEGGLWKSEILLGVNVVLPLPADAASGDGERCILIAVNHVRSPMVPLLMARRIGYQAAINFMQDVRAACRVQLRKES